MPQLQVRAFSTIDRNLAYWLLHPLPPVAANSARDIGGRMMAMTIWGRQAAGGPYAAISALTNIPATVLAFLLYDVFLCSSSRSTCFEFSPRDASKKLTGTRVGSIALTPQHVAFLRAHKMYHEDNGLVPAGYLSALGPHEDTPSSRSFDEKPIGNIAMEDNARNV